MRAVPRLCIELCPGIYLTTEENHGKTSVRAAEMCLANHCRARFVWSTWPPTSRGLDWSAGTRRSRFTLRGTRPTLGQSRYLPSRRTKGFPTSANIESKLAVRALMWSAKKGTPKSSWICLLLRYQGAPVTRKYSWFSFLLRLSQPQARKIYVNEKFQWHLRESNSRPSSL